MPKPKFNITYLKTDEKEKKEVNTELAKPKEIPDLVDKLNRPDVKVPFNLKFIPRKKIRMNPQNDYSQNDIEQLADSLLQYGLTHNIQAVYDEEEDVYVLESGERRTRALDYLFEVFKDASPDTPGYDLFLNNVKGFEIGYPINVKRKKENNGEATLTRLEEIESELRLHAPNLDIRSEDPGDRLKKIQRRKILLNEKNSLLPRAQKINVNQEIAMQEGITKRQVQKYNNILSLIPELQEEFKNSNITLNEGSTYASLSPEDQRSLANLIKSGKRLSSEEIKKVKEEANKSQEELKEKEGLIEKLLSEKATLMEEMNRKAEEHSNNMRLQEETLRNAIQKELNENNPDKLKLESLKTKLADMEQASKKMLDAEHLKVSLKNAELKKMEEEIKALKERGPVVEKVDVEAIMAETRFNSALDQATRSLDLLTDLLSVKQESIHKKKCIELLQKYMMVIQ